MIERLSASQAAPERADATRENTPVGASRGARAGPGARAYFAAYFFSRLPSTAGHTFSKYALLFVHSGPSP